MRTRDTTINMLSLHDALPILRLKLRVEGLRLLAKRSTESTAAYHAYLKGRYYWNKRTGDAFRDRKSTRLNSSHQIISYAVFCLKKKSRSMHFGNLLR